MIHEVKVRYVKRDDDGVERVHNEWYAIENCETFSETEYKVKENFNYDNYKDFDVTDIKRSRIKEIANSSDSQYDHVFIAEVKDVFTKEDGTTKDIKYKMLFFAHDFDSAKTFISEYLEQNYNMTLIGINESKFKDIF